jgi:tripartite-type tricarboxylate transporter receptor subunit TctC
MSGFLRGALAAVCLFFLSPQATHAQSAAWPQRTVKFIIPFGPGSGADIGARLISDRLSQRWGRPVVVENRPGADGLTAISAFLGANDDHVMIFAGTGSFTVHPYTREKLPYDLQRDLLPVARFSATVMALAVPAEMKINSAKEFIERAKAAPGKLNAAVPQGISEFFFDGFVKAESLEVPKVPYRDIVQGSNDLAEGRLNVMFASFATLLAATQGGKAKVLLQGGASRAPMLPDIPTAAEAGVPSLELEGLVGLFGSKTLPLDIRKRIGADIVEIVKANPDIAEKLAATGQVAMPAGPEEFEASVKKQMDQVAAAAKVLGLRKLD